MLQYCQAEQCDLISMGWALVEDGDSASISEHRTDEVRSVHGVNTVQLYHPAAFHFHPVCRALKGEQDAMSKTCASMATSAAAGLSNKNKRKAGDISAV